MYDSLGMHCTQSIHNRNENFSSFFPVKLAAMFADIDIKAGTFHIIHDEICRTIFFKISMDTDYIFISDKLCKCLGFIKKAVLTVCKALAPLSGKRNDRSPLPGGHGIGEKFLKGNFIAGLMICCSVGDPKSALAQYSFYDILSRKDRTLS